MRRQYNRPIKEKEGWSAGLADGQRSLTLSIDGLGAKLIGRWSTRESADGKKEGRNQEDTPKARTWRRRVGGSRVSFRRVDSCVSLFLFLVLFVSL
jgi:hypothetical protein